MKTYANDIPKTEMNLEKLNSFLYNRIYNSVYSETKSRINSVKWPMKERLHEYTEKRHRLLKKVG